MFPVSHIYLFVGGGGAKSYNHGRISPWIRPWWPSAPSAPPLVYHQYNELPCVRHLWRPCSMPFHLHSALHCGGFQRHS